jgi:cytoskeletal protein CcmA (bactofilin family)
MFTKTKNNDPMDPHTESSAPEASPSAAASTVSASSASAAPAAAKKPKPAPSMISSDLKVTGNLETAGDIQIEGEIEGDVRAHLLTIGESAVLRGEVVADDIVVNGRVIGRIRGLKVRLTASARVEGDVIHKTIAIESGAHFEGSVRRHEDPLGDNAGKPIRQLEDRSKVKAQSAASNAAATAAE